jgi:hypothetical protein
MAAERISPQWERSGHGRTLHPHIEANFTDFADKDK